MMKTTKNKKKGPGKSYRRGISLLELSDMFPNEERAVWWFEALRWPNAEQGKDSTERACPRCGSLGTYVVKSGKPMPYRCQDCRKYFSVKTGTAIEASNLPMRKWAYAIYLWLTSLKGVSAMKLQRDLKVSYPTAWFIAHRLREAFTSEASLFLFSGPVEVDETYMGGKRKNMSKSKRAKLEGRGTVGKVAVAGIKDRETNAVRAKVVGDTKAETLMRFILERIKPETSIFTDDAVAYDNLDNHESVKHSSSGIRAWGCPHQRGRILLADAQTRPHGNVPQAERQASPEIR